MVARVCLAEDDPAVRPHLKLIAMRLAGRHGATA